MNSELTESVQQSIRPGEMVDTYYYGETNLEKQAYPCVVNNRFNQAFTNLGAGSSTFILSPAQGISDIVLTLTLPQSGALGANYTNCAVSQGWAYQAINRISVRYGSSAQYFWTGAQVLLQNLYDCENSQKMSDLITLGGVSASGVGGATGINANASGYVYLKLPHSSVRAEGKPLPFPSDLLVQPIVITVELNAPSSFVLVGAAPGAAPNQLSAGLLQVKQETMADSSDLLSRRVDMNSHAYTYPLLYFAQNEISIPVAASVAQSVNLTGFRAGEVRSILLWLESTTANAAQKQVWGKIQEARLTYNGEVFADYRGDNGAMWAMLNDSKAPRVGISTWTDPATAAPGTQLYWTEIPFAQTNVPYDKEMKLVHGKPVLNATVQLSFNAPDNTGNWVLKAMYLYNSSLLMSRGSAEYIF